MLKRKLFMLLFLYFVSPTAYHIKSTSVFKIINCLLINLFILSCINSFWSVKESKQLRILMSSFDIVIDANYNIMASCCLTSRQNTTNSKWVNNILCLFSFLKRDALYPIIDNMWEYFSNFRQHSCICCNAF